MALVAIAVPAGSFGAAAALGAPPPNDPPAGAGAFAAYTSPNGVPSQLEAGADLTEATADPGVPHCLGGRSFARTVWYRIPEAPTPRHLTIEASGRTLDVVDLAAFVQPEVAPPPPAPPPARAHAAQALPNTFEPNVCDGRGAGGAADAFEPTSALTMLLPSNFPVLVQVGRRGPAGARVDEQALVTLEQRPVELATIPSGDIAGPHTPTLHRGRNRVKLDGGTITGEDPAQPACPSLGTVWRRLVPENSGKRLIRVSGGAASTVAVFNGRRPTGDNAVDCLNRDTTGSLDMVVSVRKRRTTWVRVGIDRIYGGVARVSVQPVKSARVIDGGSGGSDPTAYGPGGGFPGACDRADAGEARLGGPDLRGRAGDYNAYTRVPVRLRLRKSPVCDATLSLYGPGRHVYARGRAIRLKPTRGRVALPRLRTFVRGRYRLEVTGLTARGDRTRVTGKVSGRLLATGKGRGR